MVEAVTVRSATRRNRKRNRHASKSSVSRILPLTSLEDVFCRQFFPNPAPSKTFRRRGGWGYTEIRWTRPGRQPQVRAIPEKLFCRGIHSEIAHRKDEEELSTDHCPLPLRTLCGSRHKVDQLLHALAFILGV